MFLPICDMERTCLRQGDILRDIPFPVLEPRGLVVLGTQTSPDFAVTPQAPQVFPSINTLPCEHRNDPSYFTGQTKMRLCFCAVVSHCCELELKNGHLMLPAISVARVIPMKTAILNDPAKLANLRANRDPRSAAPRTFYMDYFHLPSRPELHGQEWIADFGQVMSISATEFPGILQSKILQMDGASRVKFKIKLATFLGRVIREERELGLEDPWNPRQQPDHSGNSETAVN